MSLAVKSLNPYVDYCDNCGSTEIDTTDIYTWREMYKQRFGEDY
jgi:hypothetical protein